MGRYRGKEDLRAVRNFITERSLPYLLIFPSIIVLASLILYPLCFSLWMSFYSYELGGLQPQFTGLQNYFRIWKDPVFWLAVRNTIVWVAGSVSGQLLIGMALALLINRQIRGRAFFRGVFFFPWVVPIVVTAFTWRWLYNEQYGIINHTLMSIGIIKHPLFFLSSTELAMASATLVNIWIGTPFAVVMILAALQTVPYVQYEAARVDGASALLEFWHVTLPHLSRIIGILVLLRTIWITNNFATMWLLTRGGPSQATETLPIQVYLRAFGARNFGDASSVAAVMFLMLIALIMIYLKLLKVEKE
ncbi:MAG: sugar ABC transporter permease [Thermodesulfobacteriota bacterium]